MSNYSDGIYAGVIGVGGIGACHATSLSHRVTSARVASVTDIGLSWGEELAGRFGPHAKAFKSETAFTEDEGVDAVLVVSPDGTHSELVMQCLRQDKVVLCEKPLATSMAAAREIVNAKLNHDREFVQVFFMRRHAPQHVEMIREATEDRVGRPLMFKGVYRAHGGASGVGLRVRDPHRPYTRPELRPLNAWPRGRGSLRGRGDQRSGSRRRHLKKACMNAAFRPLGEGEVDVGGLMGHLENSGYEGWYVLEQDCLVSEEPAPQRGADKRHA